MKLRRFLFSVVMFLVLLSTLIGTIGIPKAHAVSPSSVAWPVNTQTQQWTIIQGYNNCSQGGDHGDKGNCKYPNNSQLYGFDLQLQGGTTANQQVISPVTGIVQTYTATTNDTTGYCIFIQLAGTSNPPILASLCHVAYAASILGAGVTQGVPIPSVTIASTADHLHFNLRDSNNNPIPFSGSFGIKGCDGNSVDRPWDQNTVNQYQNTTIGGCGRPGGWWIAPTPSDWTHVSNSSTVSLGFQVDNANGLHGGAAYVNFTQWDMTKQQWNIIASHVIPNSNSQVFATGLFTTGSIFGADVYAVDGTQNLSPSGVRHVCFYNTCPPQSINYWNNQLVGGGQSTQPTDGFTVYQNTNYGAPFETFTYSSDSKCISLDQMAGNQHSLQFTGSYIGGYNAILYHDANCGTYLSQYSSGSSDLGLSDNQFSSLQLVKNKDTSCTVNQATANGILLIRNGAFDTSGGCKLITTASTDINDLNAVTWKGFTGIKFLGTYKLHYQALMYKDGNFGTYCGTYFLDQSYILGNCSDNQIDSIQIQPFTPSASQAVNIASSALLDHAGASAVLDDNLSTQWIAGHGVPIGLVFATPVSIQKVVVFDRDQSNTDNNQINHIQLVFSDGTVINNIDMSSGGPRCADVSFPSKQVSWVNIVPVDSSGNNGYRDVQIWDTSGANFYDSTNCVNHVSGTPVVGTGPVPLVSAPVLIPTPPPDTLLSQGQAIIASTQKNGYTAQNANDGSIGTYWEAADNTYPSTLTVDLGSVSLVDNVIMEVNWGTRGETVAIQGSTDNSTFTMIVPAALYQLGIVPVTFSATTVRYVRLVVTSNDSASAAQVAEFQAWGQASSSNGTPTPTPSPTATPTPSPTPTPSGCPSPWTCADIGTGDTGSQTFSNGTWTINGGGADIWDSADAFHYVWQAKPGNGTISTQVVSQTDSDGWAKSGVMFRQSTDAGSAFYLVATTPENGITVQYRTVFGVSAQMNAQIQGGAPVYVRATRSGNTFTADTSADGITWTPVAGSSVTLNTSGTMLAGIESDADSTAVFSNTQTS